MQSTCISSKCRLTKLIYWTVPDNGMPEDSSASRTTSIFNRTSYIHLTNPLETDMYSSSIKVCFLPSQVGVTPNEFQKAGSK